MPHPRFIALATLLALAGCTVSVNVPKELATGIQGQLDKKASAAPRVSASPKASEAPDDGPTAVPTAVPTAAPTSPPRSGPGATPTPRTMGAIVLSWSKLTPATGVSVAVTAVRKTDDQGQPFVDTSLAYRPDAPVSLTLAAAAGSQGGMVGSYTVGYAYTSPNAIRAGQPPVQVAGETTEFAPVWIAPGTSAAFEVDVRSEVLNRVWSGGKDDQPAVIIANVTFRDAVGSSIMDAAFAPLTVAVPIRAL